MLNCLSFDIESFVEANKQSFTIAATHINLRKEIYEVEKNTNIILELLQDFSCKATFFFLGSVVRNLPNVVRNVAGLGHEVALHGPEHIRIWDLTQGEFSEAVVSAKKTLEDVASKPVYGYRAPDLSITESTVWALDILQNAGFLYDASICPIGFHDVYGIKNAERFIHRLPNGLIEFPISTIEFLGTRIPFGGGGYFRLYPLFLTEMFFRKINKLGESCMMYVHPYEVGPIIPDIPTLSRYRRFRHYHNCGKVRPRLAKILSKYPLGPAIEVLSRRKLLNERAFEGERCLNPTK